jgi:hypothetical protein
MTEENLERSSRDATADDLTALDGLVERTDNGLRPDDPDEQPSQDPGALPEGTVTGQ